MALRTRTLTLDVFDFRALAADEVQVTLELADSGSLAVTADGEVISKTIGIFTDASGDATASLIPSTLYQIGGVYRIKVGETGSFDFEMPDADTTLRSLLVANATPSEATPPGQLGWLAASDRPSNPVLGLGHYDTDDGSLAIWDGDAWQAIQGSGGGSATIGAGSVGTDELADGAVTTDKIADEAVTGPKLADDAVFAPKLAEGAVTHRALATGAVTEPKISAGQIDTRVLADDAVTEDKIATSAVSYNKVDSRLRNDSNYVLNQRTNAASSTSGQVLTSRGNYDGSGATAPIFQDAATVATGGSIVNEPVWDTHEIEYDADDYDPISLPPDTTTPCLLYTSPSPRDRQKSRMPSSA